jgi:hypothetical protein
MEFTIYLQHVWSTAEGKEETGLAALWNQGSPLRSDPFLHSRSGRDFGLDFIHLLIKKKLTLFPKETSSFHSEKPQTRGNCNAGGVLQRDSGVGSRRNPAIRCVRKNRHFSWFDDLFSENEVVECPRRPLFFASWYLHPPISASN